MTDTVEPSRSRLLVVTADPSRSSDDNDATRDLIDTLVAQARYAEIEVRLTERPWSPALVRSWRDAGVGVSIGPPDPWSGPDGGWGRYSHLLLTASGARSCARAWVDHHQPQAARILYLPSLSLTAPTGAAPAGLDDEDPGLEPERAAISQVLYEHGIWAGTIWCEERADADFLRTWVPGVAIRVLPTAVEPCAHRRPWAERAGVVVPACGGADIGTGAEEAAVAALEGVVAELRRADPELICTVVSDGPSARLRERAARAGASIVATSELRLGIATARLLICPHSFGRGQRSVLLESLRAGTPFVATAPALGGLCLDGGGLLVEAGDPAAAVRRARALLGDEAAWTAAVASADRVVASRYSGPQRNRCLADALAAVGVTTGRPVTRPPSPRRATHSTWRPRAKDDPGLRPAGGAPVPPFDGPDPTTVEESYQLWAERRGPTPEVLAALTDDLRDGGPGPRFSIVMPVYNTEPDLLRAAVDSFRDQIYDRWELCIGDDGSDRPDTVQVLDELRADPRVTVVPGDRGGISAATNAALAVATGDYVAFVDHDDILKPHALAQMARWIIRDPSLDVVYSDEDKLDAGGQLRDVHLKPDFSPDLLLSQNYISHLTVVRRSLVDAVGGLRSEFDGSQDYDLLLRLVEVTDRIGHVPEPLYSWRAVPGSFAADVGSKPYAILAAERALAAVLARRGYDGGSVETVSNVGRYRVHFPLPGRPKVTIVIPTRDRVDLLRRCIDSVVGRSTYDYYEIVVVDNQTTDPSTLGYLASAPWRVIRYPLPFNYARITNLAAALVETDALLFLNNDTEVISPGWIEAMLEHAMRPEVGAVGARLLFADGTPQHEGITVGTWGDWANNVNHRGYFHRGEMVRNTSAVTGACCMIRPSVYHHVGGADPSLRVAYNDVDLCLRLRSAGYEIVYTPYAELFHHEGSTRRDYQHHEDAPRFRDRWDPRAVLDPYYSPVFSDAVPFRIEP